MLKYYNPRLQCTPIKINKKWKKKVHKYVSSTKVSQAYTEALRPTQEWSHPSHHSLFRYLVIFQGALLLNCNQSP